MIALYVVGGFILGVLVMFLYGALATSARTNEKVEERRANREDNTVTHTTDMYLVKDGKVENWDDRSPGEVQ